MNTSWIKAALFALLALACALGPAARRAGASGGRVNLTVSAAISLSKALGNLRELYRQQAPEVSVTLNLGASGILEQQIEQGAPADIFISASPEEMNALQSKGLLRSGSRRNLLKNTLVLISPGSDRRVTGFSSLLRPRVRRVAIANPESVPAGAYALQTLQHFGIYGKLRPKLIFAEDVRQVLAYVETGNVDAGLVYRTEAKLSTKVRVVAAAPDDSHSPIIYPVAVLERSKHPEAAGRFVRFLSGPEARQVFKQEGFESGD
ncbi:MAG: molybdate ABC transporter substrate-binding protein [Terriglobia bacterium]